jgi:hypothetical protein
LFRCSLFPVDLHEAGLVPRFALIQLFYSHWSLFSICSLQFDVGVVDMSQSASQMKRPNGDQLIYACMCVCSLALFCSHLSLIFVCKATVGRMILSASQ